MSLLELNDGIRQMLMWDVDRIAALVTGLIAGVAVTLTVTRYLTRRHAESKPVDPPVLPHLVEQLRAEIRTLSERTLRAEQEAAALRSTNQSLQQSIARLQQPPLQVSPTANNGAVGLGGETIELTDLAGGTATTFPTSAIPGGLRDGRTAYCGVGVWRIRGADIPCEVVRMRRFDGNARIAVTVASIPLPALTRNKLVNLLAEKATTNGFEWSDGTRTLFQVRVPQPQVVIPDLTDGELLEQAMRPN